MVCKMPEVIESKHARKLAGHSDCSFTSVNSSRRPVKLAQLCSTSPEARAPVECVRHAIECPGCGRRPVVVPCMRIAQYVMTTDTSSHTDLNYRSASAKCGRFSYC